MRRDVERARRPRRPGFTLIEMVAVLAVVSIAAGMVLARLPDVAALGLHEAGARLVERIAAARERAILEGRPVRVDLGAHLPRDVRVDGLDAAGAGAVAATLELAADGDPLPRRVRLVDAAGARVEILVPAGFARARLVREAEP